MSDRPTLCEEVCVFLEGSRQQGHTYVLGQVMQAIGMGTFTLRGRRDERPLQSPRVLFASTQEAAEFGRTYGVDPQHAVSMQRLESLRGTRGPVLVDTHALYTVARDGANAMVVLRARTAEWTRLSEEASAREGRDALELDRLARIIIDRERDFVQATDALGAQGEEMGVMRQRVERAETLAAMNADEQSRYWEGVAKEAVAKLARVRKRIGFAEAALSDEDAENGAAVMGGMG